MRTVLLILGFLACAPACSPRFDLSEPVCIVEDETFAAVDSVSRGYVFGAFDDGLSQLGTRRACPSTNPTINLIYENYYSDIDGQAFAGRLRLFKAILELPEDSVRKLALHELGHALGAGHLPCDDGPDGVPIMCQERWLARDARYTPADIREITR